MSLPIPGTRVKPVGNMLKRGYRIVVGLAVNPNITLFEKTVKPPGQDAGEPIDITTQWNDDLRTFAAQALTTMTPMTFKSAYTTASFDEVQDALNVETTVTLFFPDGATLAFFGYLQKFDTDEADDRSQPTATVTIVPTNTDPITGDEEFWVYTPPVST